MIQFMLYAIGMFAFLVTLKSWDKKLNRKEYKELILISFGLVIIYGIAKGVLV